MRLNGKTLFIIIGFIFVSVSTSYCQSFLEKVAQVAGEQKVEKVPFRFVNGTKQPLARILLKHKLTGEETIYTERIPAGEEATFDVPSGKSQLILIFYYNSSELKSVVFREALIEGDDAWLKLDEPEDWDKVKNYTPDDLPEKVHECVKKVDANADGEYDSFVYYEKMEKYPRIYYSKFDDNADGEIDRMVSPNYKNGRGVGTKWDTNGDGTWDSVHTMLFKGNAFIAHKEIVEYNGQTVWVLRNIVDPNQEMNLMRKEWDINNDGKIDKIKHFKRDQNGSIIAEEWDYDADGTIDERTAFEQETDKSNADENNDGNNEKEAQYIYDLVGNLFKEIYDFDGDGKPDKIVQYDRSCREGYDENGPKF